MKKLLFFLLALIILFPSCSRDGDAVGETTKNYDINSEDNPFMESESFLPLDTVPKDTDTEVQNTYEDITWQVSVDQLFHFDDHPLSKHCMAIFFTESEFIDPEDAEITASTPLPEYCPVYVEKYVNDHEGAIFDNNEEYFDAVEANAIAFLDKLYGEEDGEYECTNIFEDAGQITMESDGKKINFTMNTARTTLYSEAINCETVKDDILCNNDLIGQFEALLEYSGINSPFATDYYSYDFVNKKIQRETVFINAEDNPIKRALNRVTSYMSLRFVEDPSVGKVGVSAKNDEGIRLFKEYKTIPYEEAVELLNKVYPKVDLSKGFKTEIVYSTDFVFGLLIPCYRFYVSWGETPGGEVYYKAFDVIMVDLEGEIKPGYHGATIRGDERFN